MPTCCPAIAHAARGLISAAVGLGFALLWCPAIDAQIFETRRAVGGISIDANGLLANAAVDELGRLSRFRAGIVGDLAPELTQAAELRKVSLRRLEAALAECAAAGKPLPNEIECLAGLRRVDYVLVYPEQHDILLVGPGEGWKVDRRGHIVGVGTGQPVMLLDDLLVALRTAGQAARGGIGCSIDPAPEGLARLRRHVGRLQTIGDPRRTAAGIEEALGAQQITIHGVPDTTHFARVLVAADYRMKRIAMNFEPSPVRGLPSFLKMIKGSGRGMSNMLPRWWLEPQYESVLRSPDGLAWQLRGASVRAMTEEDFLTAAGDRQHTGQANPVAQRWADLMTEKYDDLAAADPIFGQLRNCMELAVVGALIAKERLAEKAGCSMPILLNAAEVKTAEFSAPKQVDSEVSMLKRGRNWVISASGGVQIDSWAVADKAQQSSVPAEIRAKVATEQSNWWWD